MNLLLLFWKLNTLSSCILSLYAYICRQMLSSALVKDVSSCCEQLLMQRLTGGRALKKKKAIECSSLNWTFTLSFPKLRECQRRGSWKTAVRLRWWEEGPWNTVICEQHGCCTYELTTAAVAWAGLHAGNAQPRMAGSAHRASCLPG